mgnify:CR=1 FL=1
MVHEKPYLLPANFQSELIDQIVDHQSARTLLMTIDLILVVMLESDEEKYIDRIMHDLSEEAADDIRKLIQRSKRNLMDLLSSKQSEFSEDVS